MSNPLKAVHLLEDRLKDLLSNYEFLKEENRVLLQNNGELQVLLQEKERQLEEQQKD